MCFVAFVACAVGEPIGRSRVNNWTFEGVKFSLNEGTWLETMSDRELISRRRIDMVVTILLVSSCHGRSVNKILERRSSLHGDIDQNVTVMVVQSSQS